MDKPRNHADATAPGRRVIALSVPNLDDPHVATAYREQVSQLAQSLGDDVDAWTDDLRDVEGWT